MFVQLSTLVFTIYFLKNIKNINGFRLNFGGMQRNSDGIQWSSKKNSVGNFDGFFLSFKHLKFRRTV